MEVQLGSLKAGWDANVEDYHHYSVIPHEMVGSLQSMAGSLLSELYELLGNGTEKRLRREKVVPVLLLFIAPGSRPSTFFFFCIKLALFVLRPLPRRF